MDKHQFKKMLDDYLAGKLTGKEKEQAEDWFENAKIHKDEDSIPWSEADQEELLAAIHQKMSSSKEARVRSISISRWLQIAATLLLMAVASYYLMDAFKAKVHYAVATDTLKKTILPDGSIVWLKSNSTLSYPEYFAGNERHVTLTGEALFEVAKDAAHPFVIQCGELTATVLGTSFNVKMGKEDIEVAVLTGKVGLTTSLDKQGIIVLPNEKAVYQIGQTKISKKPTQEDELTNAIARTEYDMHFEETSFREIVQRIEGKFNVTVKLESTALNTCTITADLTDQSLQTTLKSMADVFDFEFSIQDNVVTIRGGSCR